MATTAGDIYVRSGNTGAFTEAKYVQGGWITVVSGSDMHSLDESRVADGQVVYVQELSQTYIVSKFEAFVTPGYSGFVNSRSFASFDFPGSGGGGGSDITDLNSYTASADTRFASIEATTSSLESSIASIEIVTASLLTFTGSVNTRLDAIETFTSSLNTSNFATEGSNTFTGSQVFSGSVVFEGKAVAPTPIDGGIYFDSNFNMYIGQ